MFKHVVLISQPGANRKGINLTTSFSDEIPDFLVGDPGRIQQILLNLVNNAIKFTDTGSVFIDVWGGKEDDSTYPIKFSVKDTGIGIPKALMPRLFDPFVQADTSTTRKYGGTGLGLSIVKSLVDLMGGQVSASSNAPERGTTFTVELDLPRGHRPIITRPKSRNSGDILKRRAIELFESNDYSMVLLDCHMPVMDGFEVSRSIRRLEKTRGGKDRVPVVAITGAAMQADIDACFAAGMDGHLAKPFSREDLQNALANFL